VPTLFINLIKLDMRKTEELKKELDLLKGSEKIFGEIMLDIRNTLVSLHINSKKDAQ